MSKSEAAMLAYGYILGIGLMASLQCIITGSVIIGIGLFAFHIWQASQMIKGILAFEKCERERGTRIEAIQAIIDMCTGEPE